MVEVYQRHPNWFPGYLPSRHPEAHAQMQAQGRSVAPWRLSGKAGGTGNGYAVEYKTRVHQPLSNPMQGVGRSTVTLPVSAKPTPNPFRQQLAHEGPRSRANPALSNPIMR